jgi:hypothetical protein
MVLHRPLEPTPYLSDYDWAFKIATQDDSERRALGLIFERRVSEDFSTCGGQFLIQIVIGSPSAMFRAWFRLLLERRVRKQKIFYGDPVKCEAF